jgi:hypothetical protein
MQRVFTVVLLLALATLPLAAQRHGGGGGGGHVSMHGPSASYGGHRSAGGYGGHVGYAGGYSGARYGVGGGVSVGGSHYGGHYYAPSRYYGPRYGYGGYYGSRYYWPRYNWGFSFSYGYPYAAYSYSPYYYSYPYPYAYYATPSYPVAYSSDSNSNYQATQQLSQDVNDLKGEVRDLRDTNDQLRYELNKRATPQQPQQSYAYPRPPVNQAVPQENEGPPTLLVFKDGKRMEAKNYAVVGQTVWVLNSQQAQKYPLSQLDVEESRRLNAERGIDFAVPNK